MQKQPTEWEKIFANNMTDKRLIFNIHKQLIQFNIKKKKNQTTQFLKIGKRTEYTCFQRRHTNRQQAYEKMLNIPDHQGNENQNHMICYFTPVRMAVIKKNTNNK